MAARRPTLYLDTNVLSTLYYRGGNVQSLAWQIATRDWWDTERHFFNVYGSDALEEELSAGTYPGQEKALRTLCRLAWLPYRKEIGSCSEVLLQSKIVPTAKGGDALQLAYAVVHRLDYLMTWNQAHLANVAVQRQLRILCLKMEWRAPLLVSPANIPRVTLGQRIRRDDEETQL